VWEDDLRKARSCSNPRTCSNWTQHDTWPNGPKIRCHSTVGRERSLYQMMIAAGSDMIWTSGLMHMKVDSRSFLESICTPKSKSIRGRGGRHKLLLFWNLNVTGANATPFPSCPSFLSNKREHTFPLSK
jgi:hypothetical protein